MVKVTLDAETFKALASPTRLLVLRALDQRRKTLTELAKDLELNKATVLEHLTLLVAAGLVRKRDDEGRKWIYYELTWVGEKILHPQETTTFTVLLGLGVAAAGGGVALLGRSLGWWWESHQAEMHLADSEDGDGDQKMDVFADDANATSFAAGESPDGASMEQPPGDGTDADAEGDEPHHGGEPGTPPDPNGPESVAPTAASQSELLEQRDDNGTAPAAADEGPAAGDLFDPDSGLISLALLGCSIVFGLMAFVLRRKLRPRGKPHEGP